MSGKVGGPILRDLTGSPSLCVWRRVRRNPSPGVTGRTGKDSTDGYVMTRGAVCGYRTVGVETMSEGLRVVGDFWSDLSTKDPEK